MPVFSPLRVIVLLLSFAILPASALPEELTIQNAALKVQFFTKTGLFSVEDLRTHQTWTQSATGPKQPKPSSGEIAFTAASVPTGKQQIDLEGTYLPGKHPLQVTLALDGDKPELLVTLTAEGELQEPFNYPHGFVGGRNLIVPLTEGVRYPVDDKSIAPARLRAYSGSGLSMAFWGLTAADGEAGQMAIFETRADAQVALEQGERGLFAAPQWDSEKGQFGYARKLRYIFFDKGGYVAMCKRYREYARETGLLRTLEEKRKSIPAIDKLVGSVNVWYWEDPVPMVKEMQAAGIDRILWSNAPGHVAELNDLGVLTSHYDVYSDLMDPAKIPTLEKPANSSWVQEAWPDQIILDKNQKPTSGWTVRDKSGKMIGCAVINDSFSPAYARKRIPADLKGNPYGARFIDTATATTWHEDYATAHPMTRRESGKYRDELMGIPHEFGLVTGGETGIDSAVPGTDFLEGMMSLTSYRLKGAGHPIELPHTGPVPEALTKFQVGAFYRLPLWELVFHDCVVTTWYWYDANDSIPAIWDRRDLFNILYGTSPMFRFKLPQWQSSKDCYVASYKKIAPVARATGYSEMTDHRSLTPDALVQQTKFANGVTVTVNFGEKPYKLAEATIAPGGYKVDGLPAGN